MDIPRKDLKLHLECINGRWVTSSRNQEDAVDVQNRVGVHSPNPKGKPAQATDTAAQLTSTVPVDNFWENILSSSLDKSEDMDINKTSNETDDIIFSDQEKIEQSISAKEIEVLQPFDEGREGQETEAPMTLGVCHARTPIRSPIDVESQCVLSFRTSKGKRSNFPNRKARNPIVSEHISFPKTHVQCQKKQHVVLPTQQMKEPSGVELDGIGGVSNQKQHVMKRKRGRPKGSGKKCNRQYPDSGAVGMPFQPKGHENDLTSTEMTSFQTEDTQLPSYDVEEHQVLSKWLEKSDSSRVNNNGGTEDEAAVNDLTVVQTCTQLLSPTVEKSNPATNGGTDVEAADNELTIVQTDCTQLLNPAMVKHQISLCLKKCNPPTVEDTRDNQLMLNEATTLTGTVDEASSIDLAVVETYSTQLLSPIVVEHQTVSLCIEKSNPAINGGAEIEAANDDLTTVQTDHTQLLSPAMDDHQTLYFGTERFNPSTMEDTGDNQLMLNEATTLTVTSTKSLMYSQSSTEVESACNLKGGGDKRYQASVEVTVNTFSSSMQEDEEQLPQENGSLPFIKSFSLWESVESMDVFKLFPQHPHFRPLEKLNEEFREGIAFGKMWSLVSLMERTCQAQIDDPKSTFENKLDALNDLERHGFTVQPLRSRLETLLEIKDRYSSLDYSSKTIETEFIDDKRQFDEIIESITRLNTQLKALLMEKERKSLEVVELQKIEDENAEKFQAARLDFYSVLASPWN